MKRVVMAVVLGVGLFASLHAGSDRFDNPHPTIWRSSSTVAENGIVRIATGAIVFHGVSIDSSTVGGDTGLVYIYNSTGTALALSTGPVINTNKDCSPCWYDLYLSSGFSTQKIGGARVTYLWDWVTSPPADIKRD